MNDDVIARVPPQSLEAEQSLLGAIIVQNSRFDEAAEIVGRQDFHRDRHAWIWDAIAALMESRQAVDATTLTNALRACGKLEAVGGPSYLAELAAVVPTPSLASTYARLMREKSVHRALLSLVGEITERIHEPGLDPGFTESILADAEARLANLSGNAVRDVEPAKALVLDGVLRNLAEGVQIGIPTGFPKLDREFAGFNRAHLTVPAGRTSRGKTAFGVNVTLNAAKAGYHAAFFSLEMPTEEMWHRFIGTEALVDIFSTIKFGYSETRQARARVETARKLLVDLPLQVRYRPAMTPREFRLECRRLKREMGGRLDLVTIDYLGLMTGNHRERDEWREKSGIVRELKLIAGEMNIAIVLICQLNRQVGDHERPTSAHLRDTGSIEEHASNILFLWEPQPGKDAPEPAYAEPTPVKVIIAKQRNGPAGLVREFEFIKCYGKFAEA